MKVIIYSLIFLGIANAHAAQVCNSKITKSAPDSRYQLQADNSEIKDNTTDLVWQRCPVGQTWTGAVCNNTATSYSWTSALQQAKNIGDGWRLPNIKELKSLIENACYNPAINLKFFTGTPEDAIYWSSSTNIDDATTAWTVNFADGAAQFKLKTAPIFVRLVKNQ